MPVLKNPKHERFLAELLAGKSNADAYTAAGYSSTGATASAAATRMLKDVKVAARFAELQSRASERVIEKTAITRADILNELGTIAMAPLGHDVVRASDKRAALVDYAKIEGWAIDRSEVGKPGDFERLSDEELNSRIAAKLARREDRVAGSAGGGRAQADKAGVRTKPSGLH